MEAKKPLEDFPDHQTEVAAFNVGHDHDVGKIILDIGVMPDTETKIYWNSFSISDSDTVLVLIELLTTNLRMMTVDCEHS